MFGIFWSIESHFFLQQFLLSSGAILPQQYADQTEHRSFFDWDERFFFCGDLCSLCSLVRRTWCKRSIWILYQVQVTHRIVSGGAATSCPMQPSCTRIRYCSYQMQRRMFKVTKSKERNLQRRSSQLHPKFRLCHHQLRRREANIKFRCCIECQISHISQIDLCGEIWDFPQVHTGDTTDALYAL